MTTVYKPYKTGVSKVTHHPELHLHKFATSSATTSLPTSWSISQGLVNCGMLGNDEFGLCVEADYFHGEMFKALISVNDRVPTYEVGFKPASTRFVESIYFAYGRSLGEPGLRPDQGSDPGSWAAYAIKTKHAEFSAELDVITQSGESQVVDLNTLFQAAINFRGVALTINCPTQMQQQFDNGEVLTVGPGNEPDPEEGHGIWLSDFDFGKQQVKIATWGKVVWATFEFIQQCLTSAWVFGTKQDAVAAGYDFDAWEKVASSLPNFLDQVNPVPEAENAAKAAHDDDDDGGIISSAEGFMHEIEDRFKAALDTVPSDIKEFMKCMHKVIDAAMEKESVKVIEALVADALKAYTHGAL